MSDSLPTLSSGQRLVLWLDDAQRRREPATQASIAAALGISRSQASRTAAALVAQSLAEEGRGHVAGYGRSLTSYALTGPGRQEAGRLRADLEARVVAVRRGGREDRMRLSEALRQAPNVTLSDAWSRLAAHGRLDLDAAPEGPAEAKRFRRDLLEAPPARPFAGRERQTAEALRWAASRSPLLATEGAAGQGKSSLAAHVARTADLPRHVLWVQVTESLQAEGLLARLGRFLHALGRSGGPLPASDDEGVLVRTLGQRIGRLPLLIILDDVQKATPALQPALRALARVAVTQGNPKLWLLGRDVALPHDVVPESRPMPLPPLTDGEAEAVLDALGVASADRAALVRVCGGNPLFLVLAARGSRAPRRGVDLANYLLREVLPSLSAAERDAVETLCALRVPLPPRLFGSLGLDHAPTLGRLRQMHLTVEAAGTLDVHDVVRETLYGAMPPERRRAIHGRLAESYAPRRGREWSADDAAEFLHHLVRAGRRNEAVSWLLRNRSLFLERAETALAGGEGG